MYNVSVSPHIRDKSSTTKIMADVCIALTPALAFGVWHFGWNALIIILSSVASCVLSEIIFELIIKKPLTVFDLSAVVTGLIIALNMPPTVAWWIPAIGGVFAIVVIKMLFGGIGQNIMNPALGARCFLLISFASRMTDFAVDGERHILDTGKVGAWEEAAERELIGRARLLNGDLAQPGHVNRGVLASDGDAELFWENGDASVIRIYWV